MPRFEFNRTRYGWDFSINKSNSLHQYLAVWWLRGCDCGVYVLGKHFVRSLSRPG